MVADSWIRGLWKTKKKRDNAQAEKQKIGVLEFEVASLMSKMINLWQSLGDKQVSRLRDEVMSSVGIKKLVSDDDVYIARLICSEINENIRSIAMVVTRLSKKCNDPLLKSFELAFNELVKLGSDPYGWGMSWKKMDKKVRKMERFVVINANLYQEMELLSDLEQSLRRLKSNDDADNISLVEYEKKVARKQQEVKSLKDISLWNRTYDYTVYLLARSVFTIFNKVCDIFGINTEHEVKKSKPVESDHIHRSQSVAHSQSSVHPAETSLSRFSSEPFDDGLFTKSGPIPRKHNTNIFFSGPLQSHNPTLNTVTEGSKAISSHSGPLGVPTKKSGSIVGPSKSGIKWWRSREQPRKSQGKYEVSKTDKSTTIGPIDSRFRALRFDKNPKRGLMSAPSGTLGAAALALQYANVIIVIEKFFSSPHLIGEDAREDLYNMFPAGIRSSLRSKLKPFSKKLISSGYDRELAVEWNEAMMGILEWLAPLAHHMIRWQSEQSFEHKSFVSRSNVFLVQTLYYANLEKTEAAITELLVGLNYVWRYGRELNARAIEECTGVWTFDDYLDD